MGESQRARQSAGPTALSRPPCRSCGGLGIGGGAPEIVTGGADGCVRVWDPRVPDAVMALEPAPSESKRDCWAVAFGNSFNDSERCVAAGYDNGDVKLFDLRASAMRWETNAANGVVALEFDRRAEGGAGTGRAPAPPCLPPPPPAAAAAGRTSR